MIEAIILHSPLDLLGLHDDVVVIVITFVGWIVGITRSMDPAVLVSS